MSGSPNPITGHAIPHTTVAAAPTQQQSAPVAPAPNAPPPNLSVKPLALFQFFKQAALNCDTLDKYLLKCGELIASRSDCVGLWATQKIDSEFSEVHAMLAADDGTTWKMVEATGRRMITLASGSRQIQSARLPQAPSQTMVMCPVVSGANVELVIGGLFAPPTKPGINCSVLMGVAGQSIANWISDAKLDRMEIRSRSLTDVVALTKEIDQAQDHRTAGMKIVNTLKRLCQAKQVAFVRSKSATSNELIAISDVEQFDPHSEISKVTGLACSQSLRSSKAIMFPSDSEESSATEQFPLDRYCKTVGVDACVSIPLITKEETKIGSVLMAVTPEQLKQPGYLEHLNQILSMLTGHMDVVMRANRSASEIVWDRFSKFVKGRTAKMAAMAIGALALVMLIPMPYRIGCDCELQPVHRRYIAAPYDGILSINHIENGDVVKEGQLVAELEGRQLRIEMAGLKAEFSGTKKKRDSSMARGEVANAQIARSEMRKLESSMEMVQEKLDHLEVRSPISGIVVAGDLEKSEGAPVEMGQTLFEVGPLEKMLAEIQVPEADIPYTKPGMPIKIKLNAYPFKTWDGEIQKIHAKTEVIEGNTVFIAEVEIENENMKLKPGMKGSAKISSNYRPLGWNLFHHAGEKLRYWLIW